MRTIRRDPWSQCVFFIGRGTLAVWGIWAILFVTLRIPPLNYLIFGPFVGLPLAAILLVASLIGYVRARVQKYPSSDALAATLVSLVLAVLSYLTIDAIGHHYN